MLELPEARVIAGQIRQQLGARSIQRVIAAQSPHKFAWFTGDPQEYGQRLCGLTVTGAAAFGGQVEIRLGDMRLLFADGTRLRWHPAGAKLPEKHQLLVLLDDDSALTASVQMYGGIWCFAEGENDNPYYHVAVDKPSPYTAGFSPDYFMALADASLAQKPNLSIKGLLATEQRIPGLGNGVFQDIAFHAGLHPKRKAATLSDDQRTRLYQCIRKVLHRMALQGGRNTETDLWGAPGGYQTVLCSKTANRPCPVCGQQIYKEAYMGGSIYFCPQCQPL